MNLSDMGRYDEALEVLERSVDRALGAGSPRQAAWSGSLVGRIHLLRGDTDRARRRSTESMELTRSRAVDGVRAVAGEPAGRGGPDSRRHRPGRRPLRARLRPRLPARRSLLGRRSRPEGPASSTPTRATCPTALGWLEDASSRCTRWPDAYQWVHAYVLDAGCQVAVASGDPRAAAWVDSLARLAARGSMREFVVRSHVHRARLGQPGAAEAAAQEAAGIDNPVLADLVDRALSVARKTFFAHTGRHTPARSTGS